MAPISIPPPPPQPQTIPPPSTKPSTENFDTAEYKSSNAAILTSSITAWQNGATGAGIKIGFIDSGLNPDDPEFAGKLDSASRDVAGNRPMGDARGHGTAVASIAAAARNDSGTLGLAFDATIIMMRADEPGCSDNCDYSEDDIAEGIDAARLAGARVINLSLSGDTNSHFIDAVRRAAQAGIIIVVAAANDGSSQPSEFARQIASAAPGYVIIVGALGVSSGSGIDYNQLATFSNRAGAYAASYLAAPGYLINVAGLHGGVDNFSGTSFSAPVVTGAVALMVQAFPTLSARDIVEILMMTADDLGFSGIDVVFGGGRVNIGRAFQPVGTTTLAGASLAVSTVDNGTAPAAAGDAMATGSLGAVILDGYARAFAINLAATLQRAGRESLLERAIAGNTRSSAFGIGSVTVAMTVHDPRLFGHSLARLSMGPEEADAAKVLAAWAITKLSERSSLALGYSTGSKSLERRLAGAAPRAFMITNDVSTEPGFSARSGMAVAFRENLGPVAVTFSGESGEVPKRYFDDSFARYRLVSIMIDRKLNDTSLSLGVSRLTEDETLLGGRLGPAFGDSGAATLFFDVQAMQGIGNGWSVTGALRRGWTRFAAGSFATGAYSFELAKSGIWQSDDRVTLRLSQPLRVEKGGFSMLLPASYDYDSQSTSYGRARLSLRPGGRELAAEAGYFRELPIGSFGVNIFARRHPGHVSSASPDVGGLIHLKLRH